MFPSTLHVTPWFCGSPVTTAEKFFGCVSVTAARRGLTLTEITPGAGVTVMVADADFVWSEAEVARSTTVAGAGTAAGAVYVTAVDATPLNVPQAAPAHPAPESDQVTPAFNESFCTLAVKPCPDSICTDAVCGARLTLIGGGGRAPAAAALNATICMIHGALVPSAALAL
jgi:hypothetical protein